MSKATFGCGTDRHSRSVASSTRKKCHFLLTTTGLPGYSAIFMTTKAVRTNVLSTYRAILRELYKSVCTSSSPLLVLSHRLCVCSQLVQDLHEVRQPLGTFAPFLNPQSLEILITAHKMQSSFCVLNACTRWVTFDLSCDTSLTPTRPVTSGSLQSRHRFNCQRAYRGYGSQGRPEYACDSGWKGRIGSP
jgi:hypothetical protein